MPQNRGATDRLDSWKEIAAYVGRDVRTVIRWEQNGGLPVYRVPVGQRQAVYAFRHEIDEWMAGGTPGGLELAAALERAAGRPEWNHNTEAVPALPVPAVAEERSGSRIFISARMAIACLAGAVLLGGAYITFRTVSSRHVVFTSVKQITSDGIGKESLASDGRELFFTEDRDARVVLATVPADGGQIRLIPTPFVKTAVESVSADDKLLLILVWEGQEQERELWIVPVAGGEPRRVGQLLCHNATWAPDGQKIACAHNNQLYVTDNRGTSATLLESFSYTPDLLEWFPDGKRLRFELHDPATLHSSFWEASISSGDPPGLTSLISQQISFESCCDSSTAVGPQGASMVTGLGPTGPTIFSIVRGGWPVRSRFAATELNKVITNPTQVVQDPRANRTFVLSESASANIPSENHWYEDYLYDRKSSEVRPFLPGIRANYIDFSRDGKWITWVSENDESLWVGRSDGSDVRQLVALSGSYQLPRWSPDHRTIAFMRKTPNKTWRIFLTPVDKDAPTEASTGTDSQGAPTWSPDGKWLSYGNVLCEESGTCAIHKIDLSSRQEYTLPESEGLSTARWSPDGRWIAALRTDKHAIEIFDVKTERWKILAEDANGNDLSWSSDSRYLYASNPNGSRPGIIRVSMADGSVEAAVDLSSFRNMTGRIDTWFTLTPDNSIIFVRWLQPNEVYALSYVEK